MIATFLPLLLLVLLLPLEDAISQAESRPDLVPWHHDLVVADDATDFAGGEATDARVEKKGVVLRAASGEKTSSWISKIERPSLPFTDVVLSFNADVPDGRGIAAEIRVRESSEGEWSPWLWIAEWGEVPPRDRRVVESPAGKVDVDVFKSARPMSELQYRFVGYGGGAAVVVRRAAITFSRKLEGEPFDSGSARPISKGAVKRLAVPYRSQKWESKDIAAHVCSPTSVSMVLEFRGVDRKTREVAMSIRDPEHAIFGNWPRAVQGAWAVGVPGYLRRFENWQEVEACIADGQPVIASVGVKKGELEGAPYESTAGHLLVIVGFAEDGRVEVNDPAAADAASGRLRYRREELDRVWLARGGLSYILLPRGR